MTVFEAISEAGGVKPTGNTKLAILIRKGPDGLPKGYRLALSKGGAPTAAASTLPGSFDLVMIPESKTRPLHPWVDQSNPPPLPLPFSPPSPYLTPLPTRCPPHAPI